MPDAGANVGGRIRFTLERLGSPHHNSHLAQLFFRPLTPPVFYYAERRQMV